MIEQIKVFTEIVILRNDCENDDMNEEVAYAVQCSLRTSLVFAIEKSFVFAQVSNALMMRKVHIKRKCLFSSERSKRAYYCVHFSSRFKTFDHLLVHYL